MAKVWGLDIPEEFANFFTDFFKLDWIDGARRITKKIVVDSKLLAVSATILPKEE